VISVPQFRRHWYFAGLPFNDGVDEEFDEFDTAEIDLRERIVAGKGLTCLESGFASTLSDGTFRLETGARWHGPARRWDMTAQRRARRLARAEVRLRIRAIAERKRELQEQRKREREVEEWRQWQFQPLPPPEQKWWERTLPPIPTTTPWGMEREERVKHVAYVNSVHTTHGYYAYEHHGFWYAKRNTETTGVFGTRGLAEQWLRQEFPAVMDLDEVG
jgi:hypothetical protein